jgi:hypothetical protein
LSLFYWKSEKWVLRDLELAEIDFIDSGNVLVDFQKAQNSEIGLFWGK